MKAIIRRRPHFCLIPLQSLASAIVPQTGLCNLKGLKRLIYRMQDIGTIKTQKAPAPMKKEEKSN